MTYMFIRSITNKLTGTNFAESDARTVIRVNVGRYLKDKPGKFIFFRLHQTFFRLHRTRARSYLHKAIQQLFHSKVIQSRAKEHRGKITFQVFLNVKIRINSIHQLQIHTQLFSFRVANVLLQISAVQIYLNLLCHYLFARGIKIEFLFIYIINTFKAHSLTDRPA